MPSIDDSIPCDGKAIPFAVAIQKLRQAIDKAASAHSQEVSKLKLENDKLRDQLKRGASTAALSSQRQVSGESLNSDGVAKRDESSLCIEASSSSVTRGCSNIYAESGGVVDLDAKTLAAGDSEDDEDKVGALPEVCFCGNIFCDDATYCRKCGRPRPGVPAAACANCGSIFADDATFCRKCGVPRDRDRRPAQTEPYVEQDWMMTLTEDMNAKRTERMNAKRSANPLKDMLDELRTDTELRLSEYHGRGEEGIRFLRARQWRLKVIVRSDWFEALAASLIVFNGIALAIFLQFSGHQTGHELGMEGFATSAENRFFIDDFVFETMGTVFSVLFATELSIRILAAGRRAIFSPWIVFDSIVVGSDIFLSVFKSSINPTSLRIARLIRLLRLLTIVQHVEAFDSLLILWKALGASMSILCWSFFFLVFLQLAVGLCLAQLLSVYIQDESNDTDRRQQIHRYFGTFMRTMLTMFEITFGNWVVPCRLVSDYVNSWYGMLFVFYRGCICFAVIRVIGAVFITETMKVVADDDTVAALRKKKEQRKYLDRVRFLFTQLDEDDDGYIAYEDFGKLLSDPNLTAKASVLQITSEDVDLLCDYIKGEHEDRVNIEDFISGVKCLKKKSSALGQATIQKAIVGISDKVDLVVDTLESHSRHIDFISKTSRMKTQQFLNSEGDSPTKNMSGMSVGSAKSAGPIVRFA